MRSHETADRFEVTGMVLALKLRELSYLDPVVCENWMLKVDEFMVPISKEIYDLKSKL